MVCKRPTAVALVLAMWMASAAVCAAGSEGLSRQLDELTQRLERQREQLDALGSALASAEAAQTDWDEAGFARDLYDMRQELRQAGGSDLVPGWLTSDLKFDARVRVRYVNFGFDHPTYMNVNDRVQRVPWLDRPMRHSPRVALWFGFDKTWGGDFSTGFRLASSRGCATSPDVALGNNFDEKAIGIDRAWIAWHPKAVTDIDGIKDFRIAAGKFANPFVHQGMVWDSDVQPEGAYQRIVFGRDSWGGFEPFLTMAQLVASEQQVGSNVTCLAWQAGFNWKIDDGLRWQFAVAYYDWHGFEEAISRGLDFGGNFNDAPIGLTAANLAGNVFPNGARALTLFGNTISIDPQSGRVIYDAGDFNIINFTTSVTFDVPVGESTVPVKPFVDICRNLASAREAFVQGGSLGERNFNDGITAGVVVGELKRQGDWQAIYTYGHVEANAVVGRFGQMFFHYANYRAHLLGGGYKLHDNVDLLGGVYWVTPIYTLDPHADRTMPLARLELVFRF